MITNTNRRNCALLGAAVTAMTIILSSNIALAHSQLEKAQPGPEEIVNVAPVELQMWFTQIISEPSSEIDVYDAAKKSVRDGPITSADWKMLTMKLKIAGPGRYTVKWKVTSEDTHVTRGSYSFEVK